MNKHKKKGIFSYVISFFLTVIILFTLMVIVCAMTAKFSSKLPTILGYSISQVQTGSMKASGYEVGDYVVSGYAKESDIHVGDIVIYYRHAKTRKPMLSGDDRSDMEAIFHEVIAITNENGMTYFETKGSSNASPDSFLVPYDAIAGKHIQLSKGMGKALGIVFGGNSYIYWVLLLALIIMLNEIVSVVRVMTKMSIANKVSSGKIDLINKQSFSFNVFEYFSASQKRGLQKTAPVGMSLIFEYLLLGKVTKYNRYKQAEELAKKRCHLKDAAALTYAMEQGSEIVGQEYIEKLPKRSKKFENYSSSPQYTKSANQFVLSLWSITLAILLFFGSCLLIEFFQGKLLTQNLWYILAFTTPPILMLILAVFITSILIMRKQKSQEYFDFDVILPQRYDIFMNYKSLSDDQFDVNYKIILAKLSEGITNEKIDWYSVYVPEFAPEEFKPKKYDSEKGTLAATENNVEEQNMDNVADAKGLKVFQIRKKTHSELKEELSREYLGYYKQICKKALQIERAVLIEKNGYDLVKVGNRRVVKFQIKRGAVIAQFSLENDAIRSYLAEDKKLVKLQTTDIIVSTPERFSVAMSMLDIINSQIEREIEERKLQQRELRRKRVKKTKESDGNNKPVNMAKSDKRQE